MNALRVFLAFFALAWADRLSAMEYAPEPEYAFIRPQRTLQRIPSPSECHAARKTVERFTFTIRDKDGHIVSSQSFEVVKGCE